MIYLCISAFVLTCTTFNWSSKLENAISLTSNTSTKCTYICQTRQKEVHVMLYIPNFCFRYNFIIARSDSFIQNFRYKCYFYTQITNMSKQIAHSSKQIIFVRTNSYLFQTNPNSSEQITYASKQISYFSKQIIICPNK